MTTAADPDATTGSGTPDRDLDLRLARLHLRTGSLTMARAEYESLVAEGPLGVDELVDLAEVRWRTGDIAGAGDAAAAHLELGGGTGRALAIAAEAAAAIGRVVEAERLATRAAQRLGVAVADFFAGMPMSAAWASDPSAPGEPVSSTPPTVAAPPARAPAPVAATPAPAPVAAVPTPTPALAATDQPAAVDDPIRHAIDDATAPDVEVELDAALRALAAGRSLDAAAHLAIVLRRSPRTAPAVLDAIDAQTGPTFEIVRGDAYRLMGLETDARAAYAHASAGLSESAAIHDRVAGPQDPDGPDDDHAPNPGAVR